MFSITPQGEGSLLSKDCQNALENFRTGDAIQIGADLCPMVASDPRFEAEVKPITFEREIPKSLGAVLQLTGHPEGFFTDELEYLLGHASKYGYSLQAYSAALKARYLWPFLIIWLCLMAAFWGARTTPATGVYFPFMVMLCTYLLGTGFVHFVSRL